MKRIAICVALAACSHGEPGSARDCFAYTAPAGWKPQETKTNADLVLAGPTDFPAGGQTMHDNFIVRYLPFDGSLEAFKTQLLSMLNKPTIDQVVDEQNREHPATPPLHSGAPTPQITALTIAGHDAFRVDVTNTIAIADSPVTMVATTTFVKFGSEVVSIATGYIDSRAAVVKPLADAFIASINFDRCKR